MQSEGGKQLKKDPIHDAISELKFIKMEQKTT